MKTVKIDLKRQLLENNSNRVFDLLKLEDDLVYVRKVDCKDVEIRSISEFSEASLPFIFLSGILKDRQYTSRVVERFSEPKDVEFEGAISFTQIFKNVFETLSVGEVSCFDYEGTILHPSLSLEKYMDHTKGFVYFDGETFSVVELVFNE